MIHEKKIILNSMHDYGRYKTRIVAILEHYLTRKETKRRIATNKNIARFMLKNKSYHKIRFKRLSAFFFFFFFLSLSLSPSFFGVSLYFGNTLSVIFGFWRYHCSFRRNWYELITIQVFLWKLFEKLAIANRKSNKLIKINFKAIVEPM